MPEDIEFADIIVNLMKIEVGGHHVGARVVSGTLYRGKIVNIFVMRHHNHAGGVLAGGALDARKAAGKPRKLGIVERQVPLLRIFADIGLGCFFGDGGNGTCLEHVGAAKHDFRIFLRLILVFAGKVQIDIRHFISAEAEKGFERNFVPVTIERCAASGAVFRRKVEAGTDRAVRKKFGIFAAGADIMRRKRIYLGDAGHVCGKGRADRTTRTNQITVGVGIGNQLLRRHVQHRIAVADDGIELFFQAVAHQLRQRIAVNTCGAFPADFLQILVGTGNFRRVKSAEYRFHILHHFRNAVRICNNNLHCLFGSEVSKFVQHLLCGTEKERRLMIGVGISLPG